MEDLELIATRLTGDRWRLVDTVKGEPEAESLTQALEMWFNKTQIRCAFRLEPMKGELYAIIKDPLPPQPLQYNIYGEIPTKR